MLRQIVTKLNMMLIKSTKSLVIIFNLSSYSKENDHFNEYIFTDANR